MLILALPLHPGADAHRVSFVHSLDGITVTHSGHAAPADLPVSGGEIVAIIPWQRLSWHAVTLPPQTGNRLMAVLHGLLEDQLLDDPAQLHLAVAPHTSVRRGGATLVAAPAR